MRVYVLKYIAEKGAMEAFTNKRIAAKRENYLKRQAEAGEVTYMGKEEVSFTANAKGLCKAIEWASKNVNK